MAISVLGAVLVGLLVLSILPKLEKRRRRKRRRQLLSSFYSYMDDRDKMKWP